MNSCSPSLVVSYEENIFLSEHMCLVAPVSTHHSLVFPTKLTSDTIVEKLTLETLSDSFSTSVILAGQPSFFGSLVLYSFNNSLHDVPVYYTQSNCL